MEKGKKKKKFVLSKWLLPTSCVIGDKGHLKARKAPISTWR